MRAKNGALREELGAVIFELRRTKVFRGASMSLVLVSLGQGKRSTRSKRAT